MADNWLYLMIAFCIAAFVVESVLDLVKAKRDVRLAARDVRVAELEAARELGGTGRAT